MTNDLDARQSAQILAAVSLTMQADNPDEGTEMALKAINNAVGALLKQVPQEISRKSGIYVTCPYCGIEVLPFKHCPECGQALK